MMNTKHHVQGEHCHPTHHAKSYVPPPQSTTFSPFSRGHYGAPDTRYQNYSGSSVTINQPKTHVSRAPSSRSGDKIISGVLDLAMQGKATPEAVTAIVKEAQTNDPLWEKFTEYRVRASQTL